ncbi:hypothetical protein [Mucilaginibacter sp.]|uniref:hypothetical protein n=1 Tax=Mucilaginibacter sp. TaxID=1882438 RepID=UPI0035BBE53B
MAKVHIRKKPVTKGRHPIFLDYTPPLRNPKTGKPQRYEFLDLVISPILVTLFLSVSFNITG